MATAARGLISGFVKSAKQLLRIKPKAVPKPAPKLVPKPVPARPQPIIPGKTGRVPPPTRVPRGSAPQKKPISSQLGVATQAGLIGLTVGDLLSARDAGVAQGAGMSGAQLQAAESMGESLVKSQTLHDKTVWKIAKLEARTRLKLAKMQRNRDIAMSYLSNPVVGIGLAYGTILGVKAAMQLAAQFSTDGRVQGVVDNSKVGDPVLTMTGLTNIAGSPLPSWAQSGGMVDWVAGQINPLYGDARTAVSFLSGGKV